MAGPCAVAAYINRLWTEGFLHTYLDGTGPFRDLGLWATGIFHSTATLSSEGTCGLYGLRLMHRLNIFQSCHGHSGWAGLSFSSFVVLTLTLVASEGP